MKKRIISILLAIALLCALLPATVLTASAEIYSGTCGAKGDGSNLTWTLDTETGVLNIDGAGDMVNWDEIVPDWHSYNNYIKSAIIGNGVTSIGDHAFVFCDRLKSITIPDSVRSIGAWAFDWCTGLTSMVIPDSVTSIGDNAFWGCTGLTSITIPDSVTSIGAWAFSCCTGLISFTVDVGNAYYCSMDGVLYYKDRTTLLCYPAGKAETSFVIPNSVTTIGDGAFWECAGLTSITIPNSVTTIGDGAFWECAGLTSITIPNSVTSIGEAAFADCSGLTNVTIPDSVMIIGAYAFSACYKLINVTVDAGNSYYCSIDGVVYNKDKTTLICYPAGRAEASYVIPGSVTSIDDYAFVSCTGLTSVTIPDSVTSIGESAFEGCSGLTSVKIGNGMTSIGAWAFYDCAGLTSVTIPDSVTSIGAWAFYDCAGLTSVTISNSMTSIGEMAFGYYWDDESGENEKVAGFAIRGNQDSTAQTYAEENGFAFVALGDAPVTPPSTGFNDIAKNAWYYDAVNYAVENKLMNGVGNNNFAPDAPMTRAMLVTVLWRYEGSPEEGKNTFTDVPSGEWYTKAVAWAAHNGIVGGVGGGKFDPNGNITREQMAAILYRYAGKKGFDTTQRGALNSFPDANNVSSYATDAIAWAVAEKIIGGSDGKLLPQGNATRAQVSTILMRFIEGIAKQQATPFDTQGHTYEFVRGMYSWEAAKKIAAEKGGYLVRFDSEDEFKYVTNQATKNGYKETNFIIGARRADGSKDYYFVDADDKAVGSKLNAAASWASAYWASGEPTYEWNGDQEWIVAVEYKADAAKWTLNDIPDNAAYPADPNRHGFIVEYEP